MLRTLAQLGYVVQDGRAFSLTPRVLELGFALPLGQDWIDRALPMMKELSEQLGESCSGSILQGSRDRLCRARARPAASCQPRWRSAAGCRRFTPRSAALSSAILTARRSGAGCGRRRIEAYTPYTITDTQALFDRVRADREQGFPSSTKNSSEGSARSAVPVLDRTGQAVGAINLSAHATRTTRNEMREKFLPELRRIAQRIS